MRVYLCRTGMAAILMLGAISQVAADAVAPPPEPPSLAAALDHGDSTSAGTIGQTPITLDVNAGPWINTLRGPSPPSGIGPELNDAMPAMAWFFFDPLPPSTEGEIWKELVFVGPDMTSDTGDMWRGGTEPVMVMQHPTPEPTSFGLVALGGLLLLRRQRGALCRR